VLQVGDCVLGLIFSCSCRYPEIWPTSLPFNRRKTTCEYPYLVPRMYPFLHQWPWSWPDDLDTKTWPSYSEDVSAYQKWSF